PFFYDVASGKFECHPLEVIPRAGQPWGGSQLVYVSSKKQFFWGGTSGAWFLDYDKRTWVDAKPKGDLPTDIDHCASYDAKRDRIYYYTRGGKKPEENFLIYDIKDSTWSKPQAKGSAP